MGGSHQSTPTSKLFTTGDGKSYSPYASMYTTDPWTALSKDASNKGSLLINSDALTALVRDVNAVQTRIAAVQKVVQGLTGVSGGDKTYYYKLPPFTSLSSGNGLRNQFLTAADNLTIALSHHGQVLGEMSNAFEQAWSTYESTDADSAYGFGTSAADRASILSNLESEGTTAGGLNSALKLPDRTIPAAVVNAENFIGGLTPERNGETIRAGTATEFALPTGPAANYVAPEYPGLLGSAEMVPTANTGQDQPPWSGMQFDDLHDMYTAIQQAIQPIVNWQCVWHFMAEQLEDSFNTFTADAQPILADPTLWSGTAKDAAYDAVTQYVSSGAELWNNVQQIAANLGATAQMLADLCAYLPPVSQQDLQTWWQNNGIANGYEQNAAITALTQLGRNGMHLIYLPGVKASASAFPMFQMPALPAKPTTTTTTKTGPTGLTAAQLAALEKQLGLGQGSSSADSTTAAEQAALAAANKNGALTDLGNGTGTGSSGGGSTTAAADQAAAEEAALKADSVGTGLTGNGGSTDTAGLTGTGGSTGSTGLTATDGSTTGIGSSSDQGSTMLSALSGLAQAGTQGTQALASAAQGWQTSQTAASQSAQMARAAQAESKLPALDARLPGGGAGVSAASAGGAPTTPLAAADNSRLFPRASIAGDASGDATAADTISAARTATEGQAAGAPYGGGMGGMGGGMGKPGGPEAKERKRPSYLASAENIEDALGDNLETNRPVVGARDDEEEQQEGVPSFFTPVGPMPQFPFPTATNRQAEQNEPPHQAPAVQREMRSH